MEVEQRFPRMQLVRKAAEQYHRIRDRSRPTLNVVGRQQQQQLHQHQVSSRDSRPFIAAQPMKSDRAIRLRHMRLSTNQRWTLTPTTDWYRAKSTSIVQSGSVDPLTDTHDPNDPLMRFTSSVHLSTVPMNDLTESFLVFFTTLASHSSTHWFYSNQPHWDGEEQERLPTETRIICWRLCLFPMQSPSSGQNSSTAILAVHRKRPSESKGMHSASCFARCLARTRLLTHGRIHSWKCPMGSTVAVNYWL